MRTSVNIYKEAIDLVVECINTNKGATLENVDDEQVAFSIGECNYLFYRNFDTIKHYRYHINVLDPSSLDLKEYTFLYISEVIKYILKEIEALPKETPNQGGEIMKQIHSFGISVETIKALDTAIELLKQPQPGLDPFPVKHFKALKELEVTRANMLSVMDIEAIDEYLKS